MGTAAKSSCQSFTVGVLVSVAGNILISIALNLQRLAHLRIDNEFRSDVARRGRPRCMGYCGGDEACGHEHQHGYGTLTTPVDCEGRDTNNARNAPAAAGVVRHGTDSSLACSNDSSATTSTGVDDARRRSYLSSPFWWAGFLLMITGEAGNFLAYGFAPASVISPLGVVAIVSNCLVAPLMLGEKLRGHDLFGVSIATIGTVVIVVALPSAESSIGPHELARLFKTTASAVIESILLELGLVGLFVIASRHKLNPRVHWTGSYTALSTQGISTLLSATMWHVVTYPLTYALLAVLVGTAVMQIRYLNRALQRYDSTQVIPTQFVAFTVCVILGSATVYRDFDGATSEEALVFVGGCALTFFGVYLITMGRCKEGRLAAACEDGPATMPSAAQVAGSAAALPGNTNPTVLQPPSSRISVLDDVFDDYFADVGPVTPRERPRRPSTSATSSLLATETTLLSAPRPQSPGSMMASRRHAAEQGAPPTLMLPPPQPDSASPARGVLLRFPSAPGWMSEFATPPEQENPARRCNSTDAGQTGGRRRVRGLRTVWHVSRRSLPSATFFRPGPFLAPISGGVTAVLAESIA
ncbi:hypothetical protein KEM52_003091 [Ascosphaera acerosa]|nr:hypothetical protein KEM52_003091 [Ascosphaera acerosa]